MSGRWFNDINNAPDLPTAVKLLGELKVTLQDNKNRLSTVVHAHIKARLEKNISGLKEQYEKAQEAVARRQAEYATSEEAKKCDAGFQKQVSNILEILAPGVAEHEVNKEARERDAELIDPEFFEDSDEPEEADHDVSEEAKNHDAELIDPEYFEDSDDSDEPEEATHVVSEEVTKRQKRNASELDDSEFGSEFLSNSNSDDDDNSRPVKKQKATHDTSDSEVMMSEAPGATATPHPTSKSAVPSTAIVKQVSSSTRPSIGPVRQTTPATPKVDETNSIGAFGKRDPKAPRSPPRSKEEMARQERVQALIDGKFAFEKKMLLTSGKKYALPENLPIPLTAWEIADKKHKEQEEKEEEKKRKKEEKYMLETEKNMPMWEGRLKSGHQIPPIALKHMEKRDQWVEKNMSRWEEEAKKGHEVPYAYHEYMKEMNAEGEYDLSRSLLEKSRLGIFQKPSNPGSVSQQTIVENPAVIVKPVNEPASNAIVEEPAIEPFIIEEDTAQHDADLELMRRVQEENDNESVFDSDSDDDDTGDNHIDDDPSLWGNEEEIDTPESVQVTGAEQSQDGIQAARDAEVEAEFEKDNEEQDSIENHGHGHGVFVYSSDHQVEAQQLPSPHSETESPSTSQNGTPEPETVEEASNDDMLIDEMRLDDMNVKQLKAALSTRGLQVGGTRETLIARLQGKEPTETLSQEALTHIQNKEYNALSVGELKIVLGDRGQAVSGKKPDLINRLRVYDLDNLQGMRAGSTPYQLPSPSSDGSPTSGNNLQPAQQPSTPADYSSMLKSQLKDLYQKRGLSGGARKNMAQLRAELQKLDRQELQRSKGIPTEEDEQSRLVKEAIYRHPNATIQRPLVQPSLAKVAFGRVEKPKSSLKKKADIDNATAMAMLDQAEPAKPSVSRPQFNMQGALAMADSTPGPSSRPAARPQAGPGGPSSVTPGAPTDGIPHASDGTERFTGSTRDFIKNLMLKYKNGKERRFGS